MEDYVSVLTRTYLPEPTGSVVTGFDTWKEEELSKIPLEKLAYLIHTADLVMHVDEILQTCNRNTLERIHRFPPFGYVSQEHMETMQDRYGVLAERLTLISSLICHEVTCNGIGIDTRRVLKVRRFYQDQLDWIYKRLRKYGYMPGPGSARQLQVILEKIESSADVRFERNQDGLILTGAESLAPYADESEFIPHYLRATQLRSYLNNYLNKMTQERLYRLMQAARKLGLNWPEDVAMVKREQWLELFPEVREFLESDPRRDRCGVLTLTGRRRCKTGTTQNRNMIFQGLGADAMTLGVWNLIRAGYKVVNLVHDEVLIEVPVRKDYRGVVAKVERLLLSGIKKLVPDMEVSVESAVSTCWSKKAEKVHDDRGRLLAWRPEPTAPPKVRRVIPAAERPHTAPKKSRNLPAS